MLMRLNRTSKITIAPNTISQLDKIGIKPSRVCLILKWKLKKSTMSTKSMETHCSTLKSSFNWISVSVV